jgi:6-phosphogluconolactonase
MSHDNKYLFVTDQGMDHVNIYHFDAVKGKVKLVDVVRSELESGPRLVKISKDGRFIYILHEWKCYIDVYSYEEKDGDLCFEKIQTVETAKVSKGNNNASSALSFSLDYNYLLTSNAGDNSVVIYNVDQETGLLTKNFCLPISGEYPKDAELFPNNKFLVSLNHESNEMTFFHVNLEEGTMIMNGAGVPIKVPNCIIFYKVC